MSQFTVEPSFWQLFPTARLGVLIVLGIDNRSTNDPSIAQALAAAHADALTHVPNEPWTDNAVVSRWRNAFQLFKTKKGVRSSIEALLKRVSNGNEIGSINPLVDIYNAISLTYGVPVGGEDLSRVRGDIRLTVAAGGESFRPLGADADDPALAGEIVYLDDEGAICRCWNWRESERTMLTDSTRNAVMVLEAVDDSTDDVFWIAVQSLADSIQRHLGGDVVIHRVTQDSPTVSLPTVE